MTFEPSLHLIFSLKFISPIENFFAKVEQLIGVAFAGALPKNVNVDPIVNAIIVVSAFI
ncbi:hypothetical protein KQ296_00765 [Synechococcus sp. CS-197]|nr:hypothetical protein [Synechococcus sp. CS-197]CAK24538.1 Hypothetical protein SynWH7803_2112 [Synechococcus sp. WH 7803]